MATQQAEINITSVQKLEDATLNNLINQALAGIESASAELRSYWNTSTESEMLHSQLKDYAAQLDVLITEWKRRQIP